MRIFIVLVDSSDSVTFARRERFQFDLVLLISYDIIGCDCSQPSRSISPLHKLEQLEIRDAVSDPRFTWRFEGDSLRRYVLSREICDRCGSG